MRALFVGLIGILVCVSSLSAAEQWTNGNIQITNIIWRPGYHGVYVSSDTFHDPEGCSSQGTPQPLYVFDAATEADEQTMNRLFTLITTAMIADKRVHLFVNGCRDVLPIITGVQLNK